MKGVGRRGLLLVLLALLVLAAGFDLSRPDSWLRSAVAGRSHTTPLERMIRDVRDELPRSQPR